MAGTFKGTAAWFANPQAKASANYGVSLSGDIAQYVPEDGIPYSDSNFSHNQAFISIEHEDSGHPEDIGRTDAQYLSSALLVKDIADFYGFPIDHQHVVLHRDVPDPKIAGKTVGQTTGKTCPGGLDVERIIRMANDPLGNTSAEMIQLPARTHTMLVTKATNFDTVADFVGLGQRERENPKAGEQAVRLIEEKLTAQRPGVPAEEAVQPGLSDQPPAEVVDAFTRIMRFFKIKL